MLQKVRQVGHLGFQVGHLGHILAPSWPTWRHLGPSWRQDAPQQASKWSPRCAPNRILGQLGAKRVTEDLKSAPGASIFNDFSSNFGPNSIDFSSSFLQFPAAGSARWRLGARSALDIYTPKRSIAYIYIYIYIVF